MLNLDTLLLFIFNKILKALYTFLSEITSYITVRWFFIATSIILRIKTIKTIRTRISKSLLTIWIIINTFTFLVIIYNITLLAFTTWSLRLHSTIGIITYACSRVQHICIKALKTSSIIWII